MGSGKITKNGINKWVILLTFDFLLKPPQPVTGIFFIFMQFSAERSQNTILLASTQAVYKAPHSTV